MKTIKITFLLLLGVGLCAGQNIKNNDMIEKIEKLDSLCRAMSDEYRANVLSSIDRTADPVTRDWFSEYLYWEYNNTETPHITISEKQLDKGKLVRIAEGMFQWKRVKEFDVGDEYNQPTEMNETEYFFLNSELVKISIYKGHTDYNAMPRNYWVVVRQVDLMYQKGKLANKKAYYHVWGSITQYNDEVAEQYMEEWNVGEDMPLQKAGMIYEKLIRK
jgi:hypothetical protein